MKNLLKLLGLLLFCSYSVAFAQTDYKDGFIITLQNDTIYGQIDDQFNTTNYRKCNFKTGQGVREYFPEEILGFGYADDRYFTSGIREGFFVEVLVKGTLSLYRFKDIFYLKEEDGQIHELSSENVKKQVDGLEVIKKDDRWKRVVAYVVSDCLQEADQMLANRPLKERSLTSLIISYNECKGVEYEIYKEVKPWTRLNIGLSAGVTRTAIKMTPHTSSFFYLDDQYTSVDPTVGLVAMLYSPRITDRVIFQMELLYTQAAFSSLIKTNISTSTDYFDSFINLKTISLPLSLKYFITKGRYGLFVQGGMNYDHHSQAQVSYLRESVTGNIVNTFPETEGFDFVKSYVGFWGGIGLQKDFRHFNGSANLRYFQMTDIDNVYEITAGISKVNFNVIISR
ncbi:MAG: hypothetical protein ACLFT3_07650 [Cyclobacteriaceae bacterium]